MDVLFGCPGRLPPGQWFQPRLHLPFDGIRPRRTPISVVVRCGAMVPCPFQPIDDAGCPPQVARLPCRGEQRGLWPIFPGELSKAPGGREGCTRHWRRWHDWPGLPAPGFSRCRLDAPATACCAPGGSGFLPWRPDTHGGRCPARQAGAACFHVCPAGIAGGRRVRGGVPVPVRRCTGKVVAGMRYGAPAPLKGSILFPGARPPGQARGFKAGGEPGHHGGSRRRACQGPRGRGGGRKFAAQQARQEAHDPTSSR